MNFPSEKEKQSAFEKRSLSFPSIIDDLFNDISIRENLKRKFSADKFLPRAEIFHLKQGQTKPFHRTQPKIRHYDSFQFQDESLSSEKILSLFVKQKHTMV